MRSRQKKTWARPTPCTFAISLVLIAYYKATSKCKAGWCFKCVVAKNPRRCVQSISIWLIFLQKLEKQYLVPGSQHILKMMGRWVSFGLSDKPIEKKETRSRQPILQKMVGFPRTSEWTFRFPKIMAVSMAFHPFRILPGFPHGQALQ